MRISLRNIGIVSDANVEINGITVIAGENGTGKSTVGRALYAAFNGLHNIDKKVRDEKYNSIFMSVDNLLFNLFSEEIYMSVHRDVQDNIHSIISSDIESEDKISKIDTLIKQIADDNGVVFEELVKDPVYIKFISQIKEVINMSKETSYRILVDRYIVNEFGDQIGNVLRDDSSSISITIKDEITTISISDNRVSDVTNCKSIKAEAIYLDDPYIIDSGNSRIYHFGFRP